MKVSHAMDFASERDAQVFKDKQARDRLMHSETRCSSGTKKRKPKMDGLRDTRLSTRLLKNNVESYKSRSGGDGIKKKYRRTTGQTHGRHGNNL